MPPPKKYINPEQKIEAHKASANKYRLKPENQIKIKAYNKAYHAKKKAHLIRLKE